MLYAHPRSVTPTLDIKPVRVVAPALTPVSLEEAKAHLRVDFTDEDTLISGLIAAATERLDGWAGILGKCLVTQTWRFDFGAFPICGKLRLGMGPVASVAVTYADPSGVTQTLPSDAYRLVTDSIGPVVVLNSGMAWPAIADRADAISVLAVLGYGAPEHVPAPLKAAILLMIGDMYRFTESATAGTVNEVPMSMTVSNLIAPYRMLSF